MPQYRRGVGRRRDVPFASVTYMCKLGNWNGISRGSRRYMGPFVKCRDLALWSLEQDVLLIIFLFTLHKIITLEDNNDVVLLSFILEVCHL